MSDVRMFPTSASRTNGGPFSAFEWMLAERYLRAREGFISVIAWFSFLGIMLGVATLIVVMSVMGGFRKELIGKILGVNGHVFVQPLGQPLANYDEVAKRISALNGVVLAAPMVEGQVLSASQTASTGALVRGLREQDIRKFPIIAKNVKEGTFDGFDEGQGVAIGRRMAGLLNIGVGDKITLLSPKGASTPFGSSPRRKAYDVAVIFEVGMSEFDAGFVFMPLAESQLYFDSEGAVSVVEIFVQDPDNVDKLLPAINQAVGQPAALTDWRFRNNSFFGALEMERFVMFIILMMIVVVAGFNIISGMTMLVRDKKRGIAILRTMGATRGAILRIFFITGAAIGVIGTLLGFVLGLIITVNVETLRQGLSNVLQRPVFPPDIYFLNKLPYVLDFKEIMMIVLIALMLSLAATYIPARSAARLDPVEALRSE